MRVRQERPVLPVMLVTAGAADNREAKGVDGGMYLRCFGVIASRAV